MCGIVGAFGPSVQSLKPRSPLVVSILSHRGPDGEGVWFSSDDYCFLGHRRLAILDSSPLASQPMVDDDAALSYNGEIYNHEFLRNKYFSDQPIAFKTHSDSETLFCLLKSTPRKEALRQLEGMFAGAYYEKKEKTLFLFRDSLGIKPLYWYSMEDGTILFSSEIKGILSFFPSNNSFVDQETLETYLTFENWPQGKSLFSGIRILLPGEGLLFSLDANKQVLQEVEKWDSSYEKPKKEINKKLSHVKDYDGWIRYVRTAIEETVQSHLLSDVPLSAYLSGGLDSGTVVGIASQYHKDLLAFTGYYDVKDKWYDERILARKTAQCFQVQQIEVPITSDDFISSFDKFIQILEEPRMGMGAFSQMIVAKKASDFRRVILAGHGGDELFLGYPLFKVCMAFCQFPKFSSLKILASLNQKEWPWCVNFLFEKFAGKLYLAPRLWANFPFERKNEKDAKKTYDAFLASKFSNSFEALEAYYINTYLPGLLLVEDKISMAFSLETRTPLWSSPFLKKIQDIPPEIRMSHGRLKGLFKDAVSYWLPSQVINAPKRGFPTPFRYWFRRELREEIERRLLKEGEALDTLISKEERAKLLKSHFYKKLPFALDEKRAHRIWMLLCLESWARQFNIQWRAP